MKKIFLILFVLLSTSTHILADGLTATLQQGDVMTPFYGVYAFREAYNAAQDGAVITLSSGKFYNVSSISKQITVIGACAFSENDNEKTFLSSIDINADNVKIEGVYFSAKVSLGTSKTIKNCTLRRCYICEELYSYHEHTNTLVDQCHVRYENAIAGGKNYCIKNSSIGYFKQMNSTANIAYVSNCYVGEFNGWEIGSTKHVVKRPYAIYKNNCLGVLYGKGCEKIVLDSPSEYYNNLFCSRGSSELAQRLISYGEGCANNGNIEKFQEPEYLYGGFARPIDAPLGSDGTVVGPYGGTGFSEYPAIPRIISKSIDSNSNAEGKINVKITVKAEQ